MIDLRQTNNIAYVYGIIHLQTSESESGTIILFSLFNLAYLLSFGNMVPGRPLPVVITSSETSDSPVDYRVTWELRSRGGLPINKYKFQLSRVSRIITVKKLDYS